MKKFRTALFNGYKRTAVDEYIDELTREIEELQKKVQNGATVEHSRSQLAEENVRLQEELKVQAERLEAEKQQRQILQQKEQDFRNGRSQLEKLNADYAKDKEKLKKYESDYSEFMALMVNMKGEAKKIVTEAQSNAEQVLRMAKQEADDITATAQQNAENITQQARAEAEDYRRNVEEELVQKRQEEAECFDAARSRVADYLESLNRSQNRLIEAYEELGRVVGRLPLRIGDVFSVEPFELLEEPGEKEGASEGANGASEKQ